MDEAIRITVAIANALDYAHAHGVIHRDLKPENILLQAGQPVIADFGIALAVSNAGGNRITQTGLSLGTPQYMSPEQATGDRVIDGRSDIYSLGAVAYEMLTGEPPHTGSTSQAIIARMLTERPRPMRTSRPSIPENVEFAVQRALEKLPADRFTTAHDFAQGLLGHSTGGTTGLYSSAQAVQRSKAGAGWKSRLLDPVTAVLGVIAIGAVAFALLHKPAQQTAMRPIRFVMDVPDSLRPFDNYPWPAAVSPDGGTVVFASAGTAGVQLYSLRTDQLEPRLIPGSVGGSQVLFSPDGEWVLFEAGGSLKKVRLDGSAPITITSAASNNGADWTIKDEILIGSEGTFHGLSKVSAAGGELVEFSKPDSSKGESNYLWPIASPDGKNVVFTRWKGSLASADLATVPSDGGDVVPVGVKGIRPLAVFDRTLVYLREDAVVMAIHLDRTLRRGEGSPVPVLDPVNVIAGNNGNSGIFVSRDGALITSRGGTKSQLAWVAKDGSASVITSESKRYSHPRLSPDGSRIAVTVTDAGKSAVWIYDMASRTLSQLTSVATAQAPEWSPDGALIYYMALGGKSRLAVYSQQADGGGAPQIVAEVEGLAQGLSVAPDGKSIVYLAYNNSWDLFRTQIDSSASTSLYVGGPSDEIAPAVSPDGHWVAMVSNQTGADQVYLRSYPDPSSRIQISASGGGEPMWSKDGKTVFYRAGTSEIAARLVTSPSVRVLSRDTVVFRTSLFVGGGTLAGTDISREGRLLGLVTNKDDFQLVVVPNWR
ncbi:MAG: protein kinase, partial [Gemmatimonadales bacterium]